MTSLRSLTTVATLAAGLALATTARAAPEAGAPDFALPVDKPAPTFMLRAPDGAVVRLDELAYPGPERRRGKKQPVLLDFFRTDCGPCRQAMPDLVSIYQELRARGLEVVLVALLEPEQGREKLTRYLEENKLPFPIVVDDTDHVAKKYLGKTVKLPATFLIDRDGVLRRARYGAKGTLKEHFSEALERALVKKS